MRKPLLDTVTPSALVNAVTQQCVISMSFCSARRRDPTCLPEVQGWRIRFSAWRPLGCRRILGLLDLLDSTVERYRIEVV